MEFLVQELSRISNMESRSSIASHTVALVEFYEAIRRFENMFAPERLAEGVRGGGATLEEVRSSVAIMRSSYKNGDIRFWITLFRS